MKTEAKVNATVLAVPEAVDADALYAKLCADRDKEGVIRPSFTNTLRWAQGWNACREAMLAKAKGE